MAGTKRSWEGNPLRTDTDVAKHSTTRTAVAMSQPPVNILSMFETFRDELDEHHDRRERLIKKGRDITALSKKIIFSLHRVRKANAPIPPNIAKETQSRFTQILDLFRSTIPDITGLNSWRYLRQLSSAIQEFIEALSFHRYLETQSLITLDEVVAYLPPEILVTEEDYIMGLFDLTGEIMRFAVTSLSAGGHNTDSAAITSDPSSDNAGEKREGEGGVKQNLPRLPSTQAGIVRDLREIRSQFETISVPRRHTMQKEFGRKSEVMQGSVQKVERAAYGILVRGSERPAGWAPDLSAPVEMEIY